MYLFCLGWYFSGSVRFSSGGRSSSCWDERTVRQVVHRGCLLSTSMVFGHCRAGHASLVAAVGAVHPLSSKHVWPGHNISHIQCHDDSLNSRAIFFDSIITGHYYSYSCCCYNFDTWQEKRAPSHTKGSCIGSSCAHTYAEPPCKYPAFI